MITDRADHAGEGRRRRRSSDILVGAVIVTLLAAAVAVAALRPLLAGPSAAEGPVAPADASSGLVVAVARTAGGPGEWANWARVFKYLSEQLDRPVTVRYLSSEEEFPAVFSSERIDLALVCPHTYVDMRERGEIVGVAQPLIDGSPVTHSMLVVQAGSQVGSLAELAGKSAAVSDKTSLGGYAYLMWLCDREGLEPAELFSEMRLGDTQGQNVRDMLAGKVDCTVVNAAQGSSSLERFRVLASSPAFGTPPVVASSELDTATVEAVRAALLGFETDRDLNGEASAIAGFQRMDEGSYDFIRELRDACGHHGHGGEG